MQIIGSEVGWASLKVGETAPDLKEELMIFSECENNWETDSHLQV